MHTVLRRMAVGPWGLLAAAQTGCGQSKGLSAACAPYEEASRNTFQRGYVVSDRIAQVQPRKGPHRACP